MSASSGERPAARPAPAGMRLPVPRHVRLASIVLGTATIILGLSYALFPPVRLPELQRVSVVAVIERPLGWVLVVLGAWVLGAVLGGHARASAHAVAAVAHGVYLAAALATFVIAYPLQSPVVIALGIFPAIAHGGASLDYWSRGYR